MFLFDIKMSQHGTIFSLNNRMFIYMVWTWEIHILIQLLKDIWFYSVYILIVKSLIDTKIYKWHIISKRWACLQDWDAATSDWDAATSDWDAATSDWDAATSDWGCLASRVVRYENPAAARHWWPVNWNQIDSARQLQPVSSGPSALAISFGPSSATRLM